MSESDTVILSKPTIAVEEIQQGWRDLTLRVTQLEAEREALELENKSLRTLLERVVEHRQKSHSELVLLLTGLVSRLQLSDVGVLVSKLVEHNTAVNQTLAALVKGNADFTMPEPAVLKSLDNARKDLAAALKPLVEELLRVDTPLEREILQALPGQPDLFFAPKTVRASRCFVKGLLPRERIVREFGEEALVFFNDLTTDPKLNPRPKQEEIVLAFKNDFETLFQQNPGLVAARRQDLLALYQKCQRSKAQTDEARSQKIAFQKLSFIIELLHYYEHQSTVPPDVVFAQRLPVLVEQMVVAGPQEALDEKLVVQAENLMAFIVNRDHRQVVVNNIGKGGGTAKTLKFVLKLRAEAVPELDHEITEFLKHMVPAPPQKPPTPEAFAAVLRLVGPDRQRTIVRAVMVSDRLGKAQAQTLSKAVGAALGLQGVAEELKARAAVPPEVERQMAWLKIRELITGRGEPAAVAAAIRERLNAKYDSDEIRQSWLTLTEADPMSLIKIFCQLPYLATGKTDPIARPVMETYVTRLTHEKYAAAYHKVVNSLRNMFKAKPDSSTLVNFMALVRWVSPEAADKLCADIGMPIPAH